ncbi:hypothetical protein EAI_05810 [Harpegnathos saltator]|uniref:Uncharacterized protein n=1 Tax=Harpegnathos saltator TaxID=610380 RepID=E2BTE2_HARSA|nr:hypothetical protein EAI_05810 [Harpegnathos saltator]
MIIVCQLFSHKPDGGFAMIPLSAKFTSVYLAGLACDGNEKSSCDEKTSTHKDSSIHHTSSVNSQDIDANINLESMSKDEVDSYAKRLVLKEEEKLNASIGWDRAGAGKSATSGGRFCGTKDASNSDGSVFSETENDARTTYCLTYKAGKPEIEVNFSIVQPKPTGLPDYLNNPTKSE